MNKLNVFLTFVSYCNKGRIHNAPVKVNPDPPPQPRDMWGFGGDLVAYWQLSLAPVGGGFARFGMPVPRNVGH